MPANTQPTTASFTEFVNLLASTFDKCLTQMTSVEGTVSDASSKMDKVVTNLAQIKDVSSITTIPTEPKPESLEPLGRTYWRDIGTSPGAPR